jgi:tetratricopeptide (TPR) repeat protein
MKPQDISWPHWMRRHIAVGSEESYHDLIWSVGGSPPYGGVGVQEAEAVYQLLEEGYRGPGTANEALYRTLQGLIGKDREKTLTLQAFHLHDRIASDPESFTGADVSAGNTVARELRDDGLIAYFELLAAQLAHRSGDIGRAKELTVDSFTRLSRLTLVDAAYVVPLGKASLNGVSFAVMDGDFATARALAPLAKSAGYAPQLEAFAPSLDQPPPAVKDAAAAADRGGDFLESGDTVRALEWYQHADRLATAAGNEKLLCGLLGDLAVAFRRAGNEPRAIETNRRAIELCRKHNDDLNLARWAGNLGGLLNGRGDRAGARAALTEAAAAAKRTGRADQMSVASGNLAVLMRDEGRQTEAAELLGAAQAQARGDSKLEGIWRGNRVAMQLDIARRARERRDLVAAGKAIGAGLAQVDERVRADREVAALLLLERAAIEEAQNDLVGAAETLAEAAARFEALGDAATANKLRTIALRYGV